MNRLVKPVRELDAAARKKLEEVLQTPLADDQQIVVEPAEEKEVAADSTAAEPDPLAKYRVYKGLSDQEIEELEKIILNRDDWD